MIFSGRNSPTSATRARNPDLRGPPVDQAPHAGLGSRPVTSLVARHSGLVLPPGPSTSSLCICMIAAFTGREGSVNSVDGKDGTWIDRETVEVMESQLPRPNRLLQLSACSSGFCGWKAELKAHFDRKTLGGAGVCQGSGRTMVRRELREPPMCADD